VHVPVNTAYKGDFLRHQLVDSGSKVIVVQGDFAGRVAPVAGAELPELAAAVVVGPPDEVIDAVPTDDWDRLLESSSDEPVPDAGVRPADLACFIYTAGTTGPSKGCMLPHNYIVALADQIARAWQRRPDDVVITPLPLFHFNAISVCVVGTLVVGGKASIARRFSVSRFWPEVRRTGATIASMLGSLAILIADADDVEVPVGEIGEIVCRPTGPNLMFAGYWRRPEETLGVLRNLWFHTGDLGRLDDDGFLSFVNRKKDYLRRRGENISSFEMER